MRTIHPGLLVVFALPAMAIAAFANDDTKTIPREKFVPGASFTIQLPELGKSSRKKGEGPVELLVHVPVNYGADRPHPVVAFMGGGRGSIDQSKRWFSLLEKRNFIVFAVDYSFPAVRDPDFKSTIFCLDLLARSTTLDTKTVILSGESSGAYGLTTWLPSKNARKFCAFVPIIGGMEMSPKIVGDRPVLHIAGEKDNQKASGGRSRVEVQIECVKKLKAGGADAEIIIQPDVGHGWKPESYDDVRDWVYRKTPNPELKRMHLLSQLAVKTRLDRRKIYYYQRIAKSWWETALTEEARRKVAELEQ